MDLTWMILWRLGFWKDQVMEELHNEGNIGCTMKGYKEGGKRCLHGWDSRLCKGVVVG